MQEHKIRHIIGTLNDMAEWIYKTVPQETAKFPLEYEYRDYIAQIFPVYSPIRDVADGKKHVSLNRKTRQVTHADQVNEKTYPDVNAVPDTDALTDWDDLHEWGVTHDDGRWTALAPAIEQMKAFWED